MSRLGAFCLLAATLHATPAHAEGPVLEAKYSEGLRLRAEGKDEAALHVFEEIDHAHRSGRSQAQVALAEQALGRWREAERDLSAALETSDPWVQKNLEPLRAALVTIGRHLGSLELTGFAGRAEVIVDAQRLGALPRTVPFRVEIGAHRLELETDEYLPFSRDFEVRSGALTRVQVNLIRRPERVDTIDSPKPPSRDEHGGVNGTTVAGFVGLGLGIGAGVLSATAFVERQSVANSYNDDPACGKPGESENCARLKRSFGTWETVGIISGLSGVLIGGTGVVLLLLPHRPKGASVSVAPNGAAVRFSF